MLLIPFAWIALFFLLLLWGFGIFAIFIRVLGDHYSSSPNIFQLIWIGYASLIGFLQIYSIFFAVDRYAACIVLLVAIISFLFSYEYIIQGLRNISNFPGKLKIYIVGCVILMILIVSFNASLPLRNSDTELYHLNAVKWTSEYPAIPGIANLHGRLAFNSSFHVFAALTNIWMWKNKAVYIANSFLLLMISIEWCIHLISIPIVRIRLSHAFALATAPFVLLNIVGPDSSSLSTDLPMFVIALVIILNLLAIDYDGLSHSNSYDNVISTTNLFSWLVIIALAATVVSIKLRGVYCNDNLISFFTIPCIVQ